jgi:glycosyltransferase involved in cell wall biosynthesis
MPKIVATIPVRDEEWILSKTLTDLSTYIDEIVILDDGSMDRTPEIIRSFPKVTAIHTNPPGTKPFGNGQESTNRNKLLQMARQRGAEVVLQLDADEIFEDAMGLELPNLLAKKSSVKFPILHLWGDTEHFRVDGEYGSFIRYRLYWMRDRLRFSPQPIIATLRGWDRRNKYKSNIRLIHYGWLKQDKHLRRYHEVYLMKHPEKRVSFEEFSGSKEMQSELKIVEQNTENIKIATWQEVMGTVSQEKFRL